MMAMKAITGAWKCEKGGGGGGGGGKSFQESRDALRDSPPLVPPTPYVLK